MSALYETTATAAMRGAARNANSMWPSAVEAGDPYRVGGANFRPTLSPKFKIERGASVFAIGSCFAENVQFALDQLEFEVLRLSNKATHPKMSEWFVPSEFHETGHVYAEPFFHRYNLPSMAQEIGRLLGLDDRLDGSEQIIEVREGEYRDFHYHEHYHLPSQDSAVARRAFVKSSLDRISDVSLLILTMGVTEAWLDKATSLYLNTTPPWAAVSHEPDRYLFQVLDWPALMRCGRRIVETVTSVTPSIKILLTVSPIPLDRTFTPDHVALATMQSKSTLVSVANHLKAEFANVDYFPSFEMAMLSDRKFVWTEDGRHVRTDFVQGVMGHFADCYSREPRSTSTRGLQAGPVPVASEEGAST